MWTWLAIFAFVSGSLHYYVWRRLVHDTALPGPWPRVLTIVLAALAVVLVGSFWLSRNLPDAVRSAVMLPIYVWMGMLFIFFVIFLGIDLVRGSVKLATAFSVSPPADPARRQFLARLLGGSAAVSVAGLAFVGGRKALALSEVVVEQVEVGLKRLPRALDGFRVVQICDLHLGPTLGEDWCRGIVGKVNALEPDLIVIPGDIVDGSVQRLHGYVEPLHDLRARHGVFMCTGNHEYYSGAVAWCEYFPKLGIRVLRNETVVIGDDDASFDLAGIDDHRSRGMAPGHGPDLEKALGGRDPEREVLLLAHQPVSVHEACEHGVGLQLSGHTHGGQIWPFHYITKMAQPYLAGLHDHNGTQIYVNQGTGYWGPPLRVGTFAEITELTLRARA